MTNKKHEQQKTLANESAKPPPRHMKGPEPERLKIEGYANWEDAAAAVARAKKPAGGWPGR